MRIFDNLIDKYSNIFYVQIWETRLKVTDSSTKSVYEIPPLMAVQGKSNGKKDVIAIGDEAKTAVGENIVVINPFSHPRVLFSDFTVAEKLLQHVFKHLNKDKYFALKPVVVIHPMEKTEGGLTMIEIRAFRELALGAGAREVFVVERDTETIPLHNLNRTALFKDAEVSPSINSANNKFINVISFLVFIAVILFIALNGSFNGN